MCASAPTGRGEPFLARDCARAEGERSICGFVLSDGARVWLYAFFGSYVCLGTRRYIRRVYIFFEGGEGEFQARTV